MNAMSKSFAAFTVLAWFAIGFCRTGYHGWEGGNESGSWPMRTEVDACPGGWTNDQRNAQLGIDHAEEPYERIPFRLTAWNNISVPAIINQNYAVNLMFHTAVGDVSLAQQTLDVLTELKMEGEVESESWGGQSAIRFQRDVPLSLGPMSAGNVTVFQSMNSGRQTDGKFGPPQLRCEFIEVNFDESEIRLYDALPAKVSQWTRLPMTIERGMLFVEGTVHCGKESFEERFLVHSGYSGFALLRDDLVAQHACLAELDVIEESELTDSAGNVIRTRKAIFPQLGFSSVEYNDVPVSFFAGAVGGQSYSLVGGEFLKQANFLLDLQQGSLFLKTDK